MKITLKNKNDEREIIYFTCDESKFKITNQDFNFSITIEIEKDIYEKLKMDNYLVVFNSPLTMYDGRLSDSEIYESSLLNRKYFIEFTLMNPSEDEIHDFYNIETKLDYVNVEMSVIDYCDMIFKTKNLLLYVDDKLIDIDETIINESIISQN